MSELFTCGIDLGTTFCCFASQKDGEPVVLPSKMGNRTIPSYVCFKSDEEVFVGDSAKSIVQKYLNTTVYDIKRLIGKKIDDSGVQEDKIHWTFEIDGDDDRNAIVNITIDGKTTKYTPEKISSFLLRHMSEEAGSYNQLKKEQTRYTVITVPAYFKDSQRRATIEAGRLAGLNVLRVINEPTAAAIAYGYQYLKDESKKDIKKKILVYDFGGGTFDVSIIEVENNEINVIATGGDDHLGGEDITNNLVKYFMNKLKEESGVDISNDNKKIMILKKACEEAKKELSEMNETEILCNFLEDNDIDTTLSKSKLIEINRDKFNRTIDILKDTLNDGNLSKESIDDIVLIGGSSRIPEVERLLKSEFGDVKINKDINPDEAVAIGASVLAADICRGATEKHFENGSFALVDEDNNIISVINDIPPTLSALNTTHRSTMKKIVTKDVKLETESLDSPVESDNILVSPQLSPSQSPPQSPPPPAPQLNDDNDLNLPIEVDARPEAPTSPVDHPDIYGAIQQPIIPHTEEEISEEYLPIATELPISCNTVKETVPLELPKYINNAKPKTISQKTPPTNRLKKVIKKTPINHIKKIKSPFSSPSQQIKNKKKIMKQNNNNRKPLLLTKRHIQIHDVLSHGICKSTYRDKQKVLETIVSRNTRLPCTKRSRAYHTTKDNQKFIKFGYYESDDCVLETANKIRQCRIDRIPPHRVGEVGFVHVLSIDENQIINVRIYEESNKVPDIIMTIVK